ncbi:unnamed protein product [Acanthosepion pharaonis]|uniref:Uncharacterized protein n=1 Tax=Acanthosepion pharaonis TaxID=158019 RepID=A0A812DVN7_ACAPH|nr:unnamed protein product [Sepia pharaonis]
MIFSLIAIFLKKCSFLSHLSSILDKLSIYSLNLHYLCNNEKSLSYFIIYLTNAIFLLSHCYLLEKMFIIFSLHFYNLLDKCNDFLSNCYLLKNQHLLSLFYHLSNLIIFFIYLLEKMSSSSFLSSLLDKCNDFLFIAIFLKNATSIFSIFFLICNHFHFIAIFFEKCKCIFSPFIIFLTNAMFSLIAIYLENLTSSLHFIIYLTNAMIFSLIAIFF